jgi:hypothetical protein
MEKIKGFNFERTFVRFKGGTIPIEKFFPENLTMLLLSVMVGSALGFLYSIAGLAWYLSLPCVAAGGAAICFAVQYVGESVLDFVFRNNLPEGDSAAGLDGYCTESIYEEDWGKVILFHKEREFEVNAANALENCEIEAGKKVICVYEKDGFYFVTRVDEINKGIEP